MPGVAERVNEARYFLERMLEEENGDDFLPNFSAFLGTYRSAFYRIERTIGADEAELTWYRDELKVRGFPYKYKQKWLGGSDPILDLLKEARDTDVHEQPVPLRSRVTATITATVALSSSVTATVIHADGTRGQTVSSESPPPALPAHKEPSVTRRRFFNALPDQPVIPACEHGLAKLDSLARECRIRGIS